MVSTCYDLLFGYSCQNNGLVFIGFHQKLLYHQVFTESERDFSQLDTLLDELYITSSSYSKLHWVWQLADFCQWSCVFHPCYCLNQGHCLFCSNYIVPSFFPSYFQYFVTCSKKKILLRFFYALLSFPYFFSGYQQIFSV